MPEFKLGDKVRVLVDRYHSIKPGATCIITAVADFHSGDWECRCRSINNGMPVSLGFNFRDLARFYKHTYREL